MTILVQRKFSIYSQFLDVTLQSEDEILPGETREDALIRVHRELEATAERLRKEVKPPHSTVGQAVDNDPPPEMRQYPSSSLPIIDRSAKEKLEIAIDNAPSARDLAFLKEDASKYGLVSQYMERLKQLTNG